jgi:hypothetical protein
VDPLLNITKSYNKFFYGPKSSFEKNFSKKMPFFVLATTGASNNFGIEKIHFLRGLDTPNTPSTYERGF